MVDPERVHAHFLEQLEIPDHRLVGILHVVAVGVDPGPRTARR